MNPLPNKYPHLLPEDAQLWNDYQVVYEPQFDTFLYDVAVGPGRDPGDNFPEAIRKMAIQLSKRRIDVVGIGPDGVEIFELTMSAGLKASGQAIVYPHLLIVTWELTIPVRTTIICRTVQDGIQPVLEAYGVRLVIIPQLAHA